MKKVTIYIFLSALLCIIVITRSNAQTNTRFSKIIRYQPDSAQTLGLISALTYDSVTNCVYFCLEHTRIPPLGSATHFWWTSPVLYKMDTNGDIIKRRLDSINLVNNCAYDVVALSKNGQYLYWGGWAYDTAYDATEDYIITKTDTNLNRIWRRRYVNQGIRSAQIQSIVENGDGTLMLLGSGYTVNDPVYPTSPPKNYMLKIDSNGNLLWKRTPGQGYYDNNDQILQSLSVWRPRRRRRYY